MKIRDFVEFEQRHCAASGGVASNGLASGPDQELYFLQMQHADARRSEAAALQKSRHPLLRARAFLMRGKTAPARQALEKISHIEAQVEKVRLAAFEWDWATAIRLATAIMGRRNRSVSPLSRLTLLQVRALGLYETGDFSAAARDLIEAESYSEIFPSSQSGFYSKILMIKVQSAKHGSAEAMIERVWLLSQEISCLNADHVLTCLRAEIDLRRRSGQLFGSQLLSCLLIADAMGDRLYRAMALLECYWAGDDELRLSLASELDAALVEHPRVKRVHEEALAGGDGSTTASLIARPTGSRLTLAAFQEIGSCPHVFLPERSLLVTLRPWSVFRAEEDSQSARLLRALASGPVPKDKLFRELWKLRTYSAMLHDPLIWTALHRLRKNTGVRAEVGPAGARLRGVLVSPCPA